MAPGDTVAILSPTRPAWLAADIAALRAGATVATIDPGVGPADLDAMLAESNARVAFVAGPWELERCLGPQMRSMSRPLVVIPFDVEATRSRPDASGRRRLPLAELQLPAWVELIPTGSLELRGRAAPPGATWEVGSQAADIATIHFTAGTTGTPKGVMLSHAALLAQVRMLTEVLRVDRDDRVLLALPLGFSFARVVAWVALLAGAELRLPSRTVRLLEDIERLQPTIVPAVPKQFELLRQDLLRRFRGDTAAGRRLHGWANTVGVEASQVRQQGGHFPALLQLRHRLADLVALRPLRRTLGPDLRLLIAGGATLPADLSEWFSAIGAPIHQGYGLTECCACATLQPPGAARPGDVGPPLPGVEIEIAADGEILVRSPANMKGHMPPVASDDTYVDADGWLHTGDAGELAPDGSLRVTDRKRDVIVTAAGKVVAPAAVEAHLASANMIATAVVLGEGRPYLTALLELDEPALKRFCANQDIAYTSYADASQHPTVFRWVEREIGERNRSLAGYEAVKKFAILDRPLTVDEGDLSATWQLRRASLRRKYAALIDSFYSEGF